MNDPRDPQRWQRETAANETSVALLESLIAEDAENVSYRLTLSRALRDQSRLALYRGEPAVAQVSYEQAIELIEKLAEQFPESTSFQYELADTLRSGFAGGPAETARLSRAAKIADQLVRQHPESIEYRMLRSGTLNRLAMAQLTNGNASRAVDALQIALDDQRIVAGRHPDVVVYQVTLARLLPNMVEALRSSGRTDQAIELIDQTLALLADFQRNRQGDNRMTMRLRPAMERLRELRSELQSSELQSDNGETRGDPQDSSA